MAKINPLMIGAVAAAGYFIFKKGEEKGESKDNKDLEPETSVECIRGWVNGYCLFIDKTGDKYGYRLVTRAGDIAAAVTPEAGYNSEDDALLAATEKRDTLPAI